MIIYVIESNYYDNNCYYYHYISIDPIALARHLTELAVLMSKSVSRYSTTFSKFPDRAARRNAVVSSA